jgi:UDP-N-acetylglucosamine/UDP-N-acetylgalactosamine diphosphorylase
LIDKLSLAKKERLKRLQILAEKAKPSSGDGAGTKQDSAGRLELHEKFAEIERLFTEGLEGDAAGKYRDDFLSDFNKANVGSEKNYIGAIQGLPLQVSEKGTLWLQRIVDAFCEKVKMIVPSLNIFGK